VTARAEVRVLGLGNVLMGDDAFGPWVIEQLLADWDFPEGVTVTDVGTPGLDLTPYLADADTILIVDTVKAEAPAGTIKVYSREQLLACPPRPRLSPHDPGLTEALFTLELAGAAPSELTLVGVVPEQVAQGVRLSPAVRAAVDAAAAEVIRRLVQMGLPPRPRALATTPAPWWERAADFRTELSAGA
jgi:hydrogenase maturation protease